MASRHCLRLFYATLVPALSVRLSADQGEEPAASDAKQSATPEIVVPPSLLNYVKDDDTLRGYAEAASTKAVTPAPLSRTEELEMQLQQLDKQAGNLPSSGKEASTGAHQFFVDMHPDFLLSGGEAASPKSKASLFQETPDEKKALQQKAEADALASKAAVNLELAEKKIKAMVPVIGPADKLAEPLSAEAQIEKQEKADKLVKSVMARALDAAKRSEAAMTTTTVVVAPPLVLKADVAPLAIAAATSGALAQSGSDTAAANSLAAEKRVITDAAATTTTAKTVTDSPSEGQRKEKEAMAEYEELMAQSKSKLQSAQAEAKKEKGGCYQGHDATTEAATTTAAPVTTTESTTTESVTTTWLPAALPQLQLHTPEIDKVLGSGPGA